MLNNPLKNNNNSNRKSENIISNSEKSNHEINMKLKLFNEIEEIKMKINEVKKEIENTELNQQKSKKNFESLSEEVSQLIRIFLF